MLLYIIFLAHSLSVGQEQHVSSLIQLVFALGVVPSLLPGIGLPVEKRSKFYNLVVPKEPQENSVEKLHERIVNCTKNIVELANVPSLNQIIVSKHLGDLLAALIQLSQAPLKKPIENTSNENSNESSNGFIMTPEKYEILKCEQENFKENLMTMVDKVYQPLVGMN